MASTFPSVSMCLLSPETISETQRLGPSQPRVCSMCCSIWLREPLDAQHYQLMSWLRARFWIKLSMRPATRSGRSPSFRFCSASLWIMERVLLNLPSASCSCRSISRRAWSARRTASPTRCAFADPVRIARPTVALVLPSSRPAFPSSQQPPRPSPACRKRPFTTHADRLTPASQRRACSPNQSKRRRMAARCCLIVGARYMLCISSM